MKCMQRLIYGCLILLVACHSKPEEKLTIAVAANMQYAAEELLEVFTQETGINTQMIVGSSGKLTAQIMQSAPYDVFISADMKYPETLVENGYATEKARVYAYGKLVLVSTSDSINPNVNSLTSGSVKKIAIANPNLAPYGKAAIDFFEKKGIYEIVKPKLVYGESIVQTNQFMTSGVVQIGFTSKSTVLAKTDLFNDRWVAVDEKLYSPIAQGVVVIKRKRANRENTRLFYNFMFSEKAEEILNTFGYSR